MDYFNNGTLSADLTCYVLRSRPDVGFTDSDFDLLDDFSDPEPMKNRFNYLILGGKTYYEKPNGSDVEKVPYKFYENNGFDDGYVIVTGTPSGQAYGGNQIWLASNDKDWRGEDISAYTCGVVATHDVIAYLDGKNGQFDPFTYDEYKQSLLSFYYELRDDGKLMPIGFGDYGMILPDKICGVLNDYCSDNGVSANYSTIILNFTSLSSDSLYSIVRGGIISKHPVIYYATDMILYKLDSNGNLVEPNQLDAIDFEFHYVTITGTIEINGEKCFKVQTWGDVKYLKLDEMMDSIDGWLYYSY